MYAEPLAEKPRNKPNSSQQGEKRNRRRDVEIDRGLKAMRSPRSISRDVDHVHIGGFVLEGIDAEGTRIGHLSSPLLDCSTRSSWTGFCCMHVRGRESLPDRSGSPVAHVDQLQRTCIQSRISPGHERDVACAAVI